MAKGTVNGRTVMRLQKPDFRMLAILAAAATMPAQAAAPATSTAQNAFIPDFAGVWTHPYWPGFDPPVSGVSGIVNKARSPNGVGDSNQLVGDYTNPILKPQAA